MEAVIVFPHQLFRQHPAVASGRVIYLIEEDLFFGQYPFHQQKLVLHRSSMKHYAALLSDQGFSVRYLDHGIAKSLRSVFQLLKKIKITTVHYADTVDYLLERRLKRESRIAGITLVQYPSPNFICSVNFIDEYFSKTKRYFQTEFYMELRKQKNILMETNNPVGGSWTYDGMNRSRMPKTIIPPTSPVFSKDDITEEAIRYVQKHFSNNPGKANDFTYPVRYEQADKSLDYFLKHRFENYGIYQDAIVPDQSFLFHSVLTPALNIGLLSPEQVIRKAEKFFRSHDTVPINSAEGFIRQVLGWREFIRAVYIREGVKERTTNYWNHTRKIPASFYKGTTGIEPVDKVIKRLLETGYSNHIERLMILGNFMLLCEFDPDEVYRWFMELYIDAYDWVMVPNVYGMSQFADGGLMATKPYISSSNYILKMSHYQKGDWCTVWDGLYWRFIDKHKKVFIKNPRMSMMVKQLEKMDSKKKTMLFSTAENFLRSLQ